MSLSFGLAIKQMPNLQGEKYSLCRVIFHFLLIFQNHISVYILL